MPPSDRRVGHNQQIRCEILTVTHELLAQGALQRFSVRRIAENIDYSPAAIHVHFKDKAELLNELSEDTFAQLIEYIESFKKSEEDSLDGLLKGSRAYIDFGLNYLDQCVVTFISPPKHEQGVPDIPCEGSMGERCFRGPEGAIQACVDAGIVEGINVRTTARTWWAASHGPTYLLIAHDRFPWAELEQMIDNMLQTLVVGLLKLNTRG